MTVPAGYEWGKEEGSRRPRHLLRPAGSPAWHVLNAVATVRSTTVRNGEIGKRHWVAGLRYQLGGRGQTKAGFPTLRAAQEWAENQLTTPAPADSNDPAHG